MDIANDTNQLVSLLQDKDPEAFSTLYDNYSSALFGVICRMVKNNPVAEELLQDVFVKIWKNVQSYESAKGTLFTWMLRIARNTCIDHLRSKQHKHDRQTFETTPEDSKLFSVGPSENNFGGSNEIRKHIHGLEAKYSQVIDMVYFLGYTQEEVSHILNIPLGTVKTRSRAALKQLRVIYNN